MKYKVPFIKPSFPESGLLATDYEEIINNNWFTNFGPFEQKFRKQIAEFIGEGANACTVVNATAGLDIAVKALFNNERADNVIVPSYTFAAGPEVLINNGFTPVFADIDETMQPDINQVSQYLKQNRSSTAGILLCNIFGTGNRSIDDWELLAKDYGLPLIIDSAAGFGSEYREGERIGLKGDCEVFSFHATKPFAVGEGGVVVSRDERLIQKMKEIENFGFGTDRQIEHVGLNAKMQEINCAIGIRQLGGFATRLQARRDSLSTYKHLLTDKGFTFQDNDSLSTVAFVSAVALDSDFADNAHARLVQNGVEARRYYRPLHYEKNLARFCLKMSLGRTEDISSRTISLPLHDDMKNDDIELIANIIETV